VGKLRPLAIELRVRDARFERIDSGFWKESSLPLPDSWPCVHGWRQRPNAEFCRAKKL